MMKQIHLIMFSCKQCNVAVVCRCCLSMFVIWSLLLSVCFAATTMEQQQRQIQESTSDNIIYNVPYALAFYFANESLPASTCVTELQIVQNATYPIYASDITTDSILQTSNVNMLQQYSMSSMDSIGGGTTTTTGGGGTSNTNNDRKLIRSKQHSSSISYENEQIQQEHHRQLQSWCYALCRVAPRAWLLLNGCGSECRLHRRKLQQEVEENDNNDIHHHRNMQQESAVLVSNNTTTIITNITRITKLVDDIYYTDIGTSTKLLYGQGDLSASTFYSKVRDMIPTSNPCHNILLTMYYQRIPLVVNM